MKVFFMNTVISPKNAVFSVYLRKGVFVYFESELLDVL